ncbi:MAG: DUF1328 domain-containing protein [Planctomycetota bacterium]
MPVWSLLFFVIAIIAALIGFGGGAAGPVDIAKGVFVIFLVLFILSLLTDLVRRGATSSP